MARLSILLSPQVNGYTDYKKPRWHGVRIRLAVAVACVGMVCGAAPQAKSDCKNPQGTDGVNLDSNQTDRRQQKWTILANGKVATFFVFGGAGLNLFEINVSRNGGQPICDTKSGTNSIQYTDSNLTVCQFLPRGGGSFLVSIAVKNAGNDRAKYYLVCANNMPNMVGPEEKMRIESKAK